MPGTIRAYRALFVGDKSPLSYLVLKQLIVSPLCTQVVYDGHVNHDIFRHENAFKLTEINSSVQPPVEKAFLCSRYDGFPDMARFEYLGVRQLSFLASPLKVTECRMAAEKFKSLKRVSIFAPTLVVPDDASSPFSNVIGFLYPLVSQLLRDIYREISASDLAFAMRMNTELCGTLAANSEVSVEVLNFQDCMQIIGRNDRV